MAVKLIDSEKQNGKLVSITLQLQDESDIRIFRTLLESEPSARNCPKCSDQCGAEDEFFLKIDSPLVASSIGMDVATGMIKCSNCGHYINLSMIDYSAFPSAVQFVSALRRKYNEKKAAVSKK